MSKGLARKLYNDPSTERRWNELRDAKDQWLRFAAEKFIWEQAEGKAVQRQEDTITYDPAAPLRVIVEHMGRPKDQLAIDALHFPRLGSGEAREGSESGDRG